MADLKQLLGATHPAGTCPIVIFVPETDQEGKPIDQEYWRDQALEVLGDSFPRRYGIPARQRRMVR